MRFDEAIRPFEFIKNEDEPCVYKKISGSAITFVVLYVNDILLIENDVGMLSSLKAWLTRLNRMVVECTRLSVKIKS